MRGGWHRMFALKIAAGFQPGGAGTCNPATGSPPLCLSLDSLDASGTASSGSTTLAAALVFSGRVLQNGVARPVDDMRRYFEQSNDDIDAVANNDLDTAESLPALRVLSNAPAPDDRFDDQVRGFER